MRAHDAYLAASDERPLPLLWSIDDSGYACSAWVCAADGRPRIQEFHGRAARARAEAWATGRDLAPGSLDSLARRLP